MAECFYFGCWNQPGHYIRSAPGQRDLSYDERQKVVYYNGDIHIDGSLAPRRDQRTGEFRWEGQRQQRDAQGRMIHTSECQQGQFLLHVLDNGYTAIQWWDRCQGDKRGACNSTILLEGEHSADEMLAALHQHFPHVVENLKRAGVDLVEVKPA